MSAAWITAFAVLSAAHEGEFESACEETISASDAIMVQHPFLHVRVRDPAEEVVLLLALSRCGQHHWVVPGNYAFPAEWETEVRDIASFHSIRASIIPSVSFQLELRHGGLLDDLRAALLSRAPTFGPTYPRIIAA
jgi:hypothetical protein